MKAENDYFYAIIKIPAKICKEDAFAAYKIMQINFDGYQTKVWRDAYDDKYPRILMRVGECIAVNLPKKWLIKI
jgi:hypothetical protein